RRQGGSDRLVVLHSAVDVRLDPTVAAEPLGQTFPASRLAGAKQRPDPDNGAHRLYDEPWALARQRPLVEVAQAALQVVIGDDDREVAVRRGAETDVRQCSLDRLRDDPSDRVDR